MSQLRTIQTTEPATAEQSPDIRTKPDGQILIEHDYTSTEWNDYGPVNKRRRHHARVITLSSSTNSYIAQPELQAFATVTFAGECWQEDDTPAHPAIGFRNPITLQRFYQTQAPDTFRLTWHEVEILHCAISDWLRDHCEMPELTETSDLPGERPF